MKDKVFKAHSVWEWLNENGHQFFDENGEEWDEDAAYVAVLKRFKLTDTQEMADLVWPVIAEYSVNYA